MMSVRYLIIYSMMVFMLLVSSIAVSTAAEGWEAGISVSVLNAENRLSLGLRPDATDGRDGKYDVPPMLAGNIKAYFLGQSGKLWRDIRSSLPGKKIWDLRIESDLEGEETIIKWNSRAFPAGISVSLVDPEAGKMVDMKKIDTYKYKNTGSRDIKIEAEF